MSVTTPHEHQSGLDISSLTDLSADRARRLIDQEVQRLEDSIRALRSHRNVLAPISHLPPEMLSKIFAYRVADCLGNAPLEWIRVTHVSRHWRAVAFDCPSLWGHLVFTRPKWCQEMLKRSKMASLVVKADLTCITPRIFEAVRLALLHAPRIHDLQLRAGSATIQRLLTAEPAFQLPMIRSLSLSVPPAPRFGTDEGFELPETILTGETPYLRRLELHKVNVAWDSQLLQGLTHLTIHDVSASARPTMELFMDALERMSALEVLDIQNALPQFPLGSASDRVVELRHLAQLKITSTVPECGNLATHITIPASARVHLSCSGTEASGGDFSSVMRLISNPRGAGRHPDGCAPDRKIIRVLHVRHEAPISLVLQGWTDALSVREAHPQINTPDIQLHFSWHHTPQTAVNSVTSAICKVIPIAHLRSLRMEQVDGFNSKMWTNHFGFLPKLHSMHIAGDSAHALISALREAVPTELLSPVTPVTPGGMLTVRRPGLRRSRSAIPSVYFPELKVLTLEDVSFDELVGAPSSPRFEILQSSLLGRSDQKMEIRELRLRECSHLFEEHVAKLKKLVHTVDWDMIEQGFPGDDESVYGYDEMGAYIFGNYDTYGEEPNVDLDFGFNPIF